MQSVSPGRVVRSVGSLDARALANFVADLWEARGWEATVEGELVSVSDGPFGDDERIRCVSPGRWARPALPDDDPIDVVVATRDARELRETAAARGARFVGPTELGEVIRYAIDPEEADRVFASHFGRPLPREDRPRTSRRPSRSTPGPAIVAGVLLLVVAAGLVLAGAGGVPGGVFDNGSVGTAGDDPSPETAELDSVSSASDDGPEANASDLVGGYPPGLGPAGVVDVDTLATAHGQAILRVPYDLLIVHRGSEDLLAPDRVWVSSRQTVDRVSGERYWYRVSGFDLTDDGALASVIYDDYADGTYDYRRTASSTVPEYRRGLIPTGGGNGLFTALAEAYLRRYLDTSESQIDVVERFGRTTFRIVATGTPERLPWPVSDYRAVALLDRSGQVYHLSVEYVRLDRRRDPPQLPARTPEVTNDTAASFTEGTVQFELVYRNIGEATVAEPPWYDEARDAANETDVALWPTDSQWWTQPIGVDYREDG